MQVVIAAGQSSCSAALALSAEGIEFNIHIVQDDLHYGKLLKDYWEQGKGFILVEHDIAPWPGSLRRLWNCTKKFCGYGYPIGNFGNLCYSLGCTKFSKEFVSEFPNLPEFWENESWTSLDGKVMEASRKVLGVDDLHRHTPPVAHLKGISWNLQ